MKRSSVFLMRNFTVHDLDLIKKDLAYHSVQMALKIKNLNLPKKQIEVIVDLAINKVISAHKFGDDKRIGELVKVQVLADLRTEHYKSYIDRLNKVKWPDLNRDRKKIQKKKITDRRIEIIQRLNNLSPDLIEKLNTVLDSRQRDILMFVLTSSSMEFNKDLERRFNICQAAFSNHIKKIYMEFFKLLKILRMIH